MANPAPDPGDSSAAARQRDNGGAARPSESAGAFGADLRARIGPAIALMAGALASAWAGGYWFAAFWLIAALVVHWEWQRMVGGLAQRLRLACGSAALAVAAPLAIEGRAGLAIAALMIGAAGAALAAGARAPRWLAGAGVLYAGAMLVAACLLRASRLDGLYAIVWLFAVVWGADIMAFLGGRLIGGPKLWPRLSPKKTWSGFLVGVTCGAAAGLIGAPVANSSAALFGFGLAVAAIAQAGDLFESALKRQFGVKDSSQLIPGHGGLMDRLDGFAAATLATALAAAARYPIADLAAGIFQW